MWQNIGYVFLEQSQLMSKKLRSFLERFSFSSSVASSYEMPIVTAKRTKVFWRNDKIYLEKMKK